MRSLPALLVCVLLAGCATSGGVAPVAGGRTGSLPLLARTFPTATGAVEQPGTVTGALSVPGGSDRVPAVIVLHSCSGVTPNVTEWARALNRMGYVALVLDSFTGRGVNEVCTGHTPVSVGSRLADVFRAQELLVTHPRIDPGRIGVLGFSHGGWVTLWASQAWYQRRFMRGTLPPPAAYAAFYPAGCNARLVDGLRCARPQAVGRRPQGVLRAGVLTPLSGAEKNCRAPFRARGRECPVAAATLPLDQRVARQDRHRGRRDRRRRADRRQRADGRRRGEGRQRAGSRQGVRRQRRQRAGRRQRARRR